MAQKAKTANKRSVSVFRGFKRKFILAFCWREVEKTKGDDCGFAAFLAESLEFLNSAKGVEYKSQGQARSGSGERRPWSTRAPFRSYEGA